MALVVAVVGPTATGKSDLGLALGEALRGEVVNADAMQLYRGMDIGTAKLTLDERHGIPHHLLDVLDPHEDASVADYQGRARTAFGDIESRGHRSVAVGGSGLYLRALLDHMDFPGTDPQMRAALEARVEAEGARALHCSSSRVGRPGGRRGHRTPQRPADRARPRSDRVDRPEVLGLAPAARLRGSPRCSLGIDW